MAYKNELQVLLQIVDVMQVASEKLDSAIKRNNLEEIQKIKLFILDLQKKADIISRNIIK